MKKYWGMKALTVLLSGILTFPADAAEMPARVLIETREGDIVAEIYAKEAPKTSAQFFRYVNEGYYNGGTFFRTVRTDVNQDKNFVQIDVIQADTHPWKARSLHDPVALEPTSVTGLRHVDGTLSMARSSEKDSGNEQFFICIGDQPELDAGGKRHPDGFGFAAFGRVVEGMDVVRKIHLMDNEGQAIRIPVQMLSVKALP